MKSVANTLIVLILLHLVLSVSVFGQSENSWQPDSVYKNRHVKKITTYLNSPKDLSEVIYFNKEGHRIRTVKYSVSHAAKTRKNKKVEMTSHYKYDSNMRLVQIIDSAAHWDKSFTVDNTYFNYDAQDNLSKSLYYKGKSTTPSYETHFSYEPCRSVTIQRKDSLIVYHKTKEFENDFYVRRFYGYYLEPKLKNGLAVQGHDTLHYQYSDYNELQKFDDDMVFVNTFNTEGRIINSDINSVFMNDRRTKYKISYYYYPNGLLESIRGYIPEFFEYEFSKSNKCDKIEGGTYRVDFKTEGFEDYELAIAKNTYTKILKNGSSENGSLEWRDNCLLVLLDSPNTTKEPLVEKIQEGLGVPCMQFLKRKGKTIYFRTTRSANLNIIINEGRLIKLK